MTRTESSDFNSLIAVNLAGFFHITTRPIKHMLDRGAGHIVDVWTTLVEYADSTTGRAANPHQGEPE
jgi:NAD(P)-dependent dehydrogenase (short-subunit alcohol dehydrogenase family)